MSERREDALRRLMDSRGNLSPARASSQEKMSTSPQSRSKPESMSLAAFMGGRASGPRLNKHAPQQDAHDPTQFEQRTRAEAPHPIFGRGGVAMPGMAGNEKTSAKSSQTRGLLDRSHSAGPVGNQGISSSTLPATKLHVEDQPAVSEFWIWIWGSRP